MSLVMYSVGDSVIHLYFYQYSINFIYKLFSNPGNKNVMNIYMVMLNKKKM